MQKETWSIGFACALGACIGTLVALEIATRFEYGSWFWGIGALTGGFVAYCAVDFQHLCAGVAIAYRETIAWRPHIEWWKTYLLCVCPAGMLLITLFIVMWCIVSIIEGKFNTSLSPTDLLLLFILGAFSSLLSGLMLPSRKNNTTVESYNQKLLEERKQALKAIFHLSPVGLFLLVVAGILVGAEWLWIHGPNIARSTIAAARFAALKVRQFGVETFFYVHSERRKICFLDAAIGAMVGYFFGSASIGGVVGAILGVVNYEIVSIRWLKIFPVKKA